MPCRPDLPCADCGKLMYRSKESLPEGQAVCRPCRRLRPREMPTPWPGTCQRCGVSFLGKRRDALYCSADCRARAHRRIDCVDCGGDMYSGKNSLPEGQARCRSCRRQRPTQHSRVCAHCSKQFVASYGRAKFCSRTCFNLDHSKRGNRQPRPCQVCGSTYKPTYSAQRTCGRICGATVNAHVLANRLRGRQPRAPRTPIWIRDCDVCSKVFVARYGATRRCSAQCRIDHSGVRVKDLYATALRMRRGGQQWRLLLVDYLRERDGDRCSLCRKRMDFTLPAGPLGHDKGVTVDHVVPRSHGGSDDPANLRLAHWRCNRERRTGGGNEQLALVG